MAHRPKTTFPRWLFLLAPLIAFLLAILFLITVQADEGTPSDAPLPANFSFSPSVPESDSPQEPDALLSGLASGPAPALAPSSDYLDFNDTRLEVSFEYPTNWFVTGSGPHQDWVTVENTDPARYVSATTKSGTEAFHLEIAPLPGVGAAGSLNDYVAATFKNLLRGSIQSQQEIEPLNGLEAIQVIYRDPGTSDNVRAEIFARDGSKIWRLQLDPGDTQYSAVLEHLLQSLQFR